MNGFVGILAIGCYIGHCTEKYKPYGRTLIHYNAVDSDEEDDRDFNIQADRERPGPNKCKIFFRRQWTFNTVVLILSMYYAVVAFFPSGFMLGREYGFKATKPLNLTSEFTLRIRDWSLKPYIDI